MVGEFSKTAGRDKGADHLSEWNEEIQTLAPNRADHLLAHRIAVVIVDQIWMCLQLRRGAADSLRRDGE
jgi:hypothetical protein